MSFLTAAVVSGAGALAGGIGGAFISSGATRYAADTQAAAADKANQLQYQMWQQQQENQKPWLQAGTAALSQLQDPSFQKTFGQSFDPNNIEAIDPGFNFRMQQGQKALERSAAARGGLQSGGTLKELSRYSQDYASNEYQNAYNRFTNDQTNRFNRLASIAGIGQTANNTLASLGQGYAGQIGQNTMGAANAAAAASIASGNQWGNTLSSLGTGLGNNAIQYATLSKLFPGGASHTAEPAVASLAEMNKPEYGWGL